MRATALSLSLTLSLSLLFFFFLSLIFVFPHLSFSLLFQTSNNSYGFHSVLLPSSSRLSLSLPHHLLRPPLRRPRVLALDGGGMKGLATLRLLRALQARLGPDERARPLVDAFDLVVGTSTGAILAAALVARRMTLDEVYRMCVMTKREREKKKREKKKRERDGNAIFFYLLLRRG